MFAGTGLASMEPSNDRHISAFYRAVTPIVRSCRAAKWRMIGHCRLPMI